MPRSVLISFLGINNYQAIRYAAPNSNSTTPPTRFVQRAMIDFFCADFSNIDQLYFFTTRDAYQKTWKGDAELGNGLEAELQSSDIKCKYSQIFIPDGRSTEEIWSIFEIVFQQLQHGDQVIFDSTHGFRSLPMLNMVLINYAKLLKEIRVLGIYYGAFDAKYNDPEKEAWIAPIWDLTDFANLQDWTNGAQLFLKAGNATALVRQIEAPQFDELKSKLSSFSEMTLSNRGVDIYEGKVMAWLNHFLDQPRPAVHGADKALLPVLEKIKQAFSAYQLNTALNGFVAVRWCIDNGLIQQAFTLMEEFLITFVMVELQQDQYIADVDRRKTISSALLIGNQSRFNFVKLFDKKYIAKNNYITQELADQRVLLREWQQEILPLVRAYPFKSAIGTLLKAIKSTARDDINHAGFREQPADYRTLALDAEEKHQAIRQLVEKIKGVVLPE